MSAYIIVDIHITDSRIYEAYRDSVQSTVAAYGGKFLARGGKAENLEGNWVPERIVILEFESTERAKQWWASEEYREPKKLRQSASATNMIVVDGVRNNPCGEHRDP